MLKLNDLNIYNFILSVEILFLSSSVKIQTNKTKSTMVEILFLSSDQYCQIAKDEISKW